jgi:hypothetical protein
MDDRTSKHAQLLDIVLEQPFGSRRSLNRRLFRVGSHAP